MSVGAKRLAAFRGKTDARGNREYPGHLGYLRHEMPQITSEHAPALRDWLKGKGVGIEDGTAKVSDLKPTQREVNPDKVAQLPAEKLGKPLMVSSDGHILDGHNRWARMLAENPGQSVKTVRIDKPAREAVALLNTFPQVKHQDVEATGKTTGGEEKAPMDSHKTAAMRAKLAAMRGDNAKRAADLAATRGRVDALKQQIAAVPKPPDPAAHLAQLREKIRTTNEATAKIGKGFAREDRARDRGPVQTGKRGGRYATLPSGRKVYFN